MKITFIIFSFKNKIKKVMNEKNKKILTCLYYLQFLYADVVIYVLRKKKYLSKSFKHRLTDIYSLRWIFMSFLSFPLLQNLKWKVSTGYCFYLSLHDLFMDSYYVDIVEQIMFMGTDWRRLGSRYLRL